MGRCLIELPEATITQWGEVSIQPCNPEERFLKKRTVAKIRKPVGSAKVGETKRQYFLSWDATVPSLTLASAHRLVQHFSPFLSLPHCGRKGLRPLKAPQTVSVLLKLPDLLAVLQIVMTRHGQIRHVQKS